MRKMLRNERGNLTVALVLAVVGLMSGFTMANLAMRDVVGFNYDYDTVQALHSLRSEGVRGQAVVSLTGFTGSQMYLRPKTMEIVSSNMKKTIKLRSLVTEDEIQIAQGGFKTGGYTVRTLSQPARGTGRVVIGTRNDSIVRKYGEFTLRKRTFSEFHYFTDNEESTNGTNVYFWGPDVIKGRLHSNTDIWIKQAGGGSNNGWPTFWELVTTAGKIQSFSGVIPNDDVFLDGYVEDYHTYEYPPLANNVRVNGHHIGNEDANDLIFMINSEGSYASVYRGQVMVRRDSASVYASYPPIPGPYLFRNSWTGADTVWTQMSNMSNRRSVFCNNKLWLRGSFTGRQTFGAADTLFLVGDITLTGTVPGSAPDDRFNYNRNDIVGIISEKSILIKYGFVDPDTLVGRVHPNVGPDAGGGIFIYAALCALGQSTNSHFDGVFSYEYQHPHPSTQAYVHQGVLYSRIDIHRRRYPPISGTPWPTLPNGSQVTPRPALDLPYYNPLWPERQPYAERGSINLWGSVAQRRRGFVHRSGNDGEYPSNSGIWNVPEDMCGHPISINWTEPIVQGGQSFTFSKRNAVGSTGSGSGYKKNYHFDTRFLRVSPNDFPDVNLRGGSTPLQGEIWTLKKPPTSL